MEALLARPAPDLPDRLVRAGFVRRETEALLVADLAETTLDASPPADVHLRAVIDASGVDALVSVHEEVFGEDHSALGRVLLDALQRRPAPLAAVVAVAGDTPIAAGRVEFHAGTEFASLWGGGTVAAWRGRGVFRALVAHRAALAAERGFRYLQVDALPASRPILKRLGFVELATTTPFEFASPSDGVPATRREPLRRNSRGFPHSGPLWCPGTSEAMTHPPHRSKPVTGHAYSVPVVRELPQPRWPWPAAELRG